MHARLPVGGLVGPRLWRKRTGNLAGIQQEGSRDKRRACLGLALGLGWASHEHWACVRACARARVSTVQEWGVRPCTTVERRVGVLRYMCMWYGFGGGGCCGRGRGGAAACIDLLDFFIHHPPMKLEVRRACVHLVIISSAAATSRSLTLPPPTTPALPSSTRPLIFRNPPPSLPALSSLKRTPPTPSPPRHSPTSPSPPDLADPDRSSRPTSLPPPSAAPRTPQTPSTQQSSPIPSCGVIETSTRIAEPESKSKFGIGIGNGEERRGEEAGVVSFWRSLGA